MIAPADGNNDNEDDAAATAATITSTTLIKPAPAPPAPASSSSSRHLPFNKQNSNRDQEAADEVDLMDSRIEMVDTGDPPPLTHPPLTPEPSLPPSTP